MTSDGRLLTLEYDSRCLADNPLADPAQRRFPVWLPPQYDTAPSGRRFPVIFDLAAYTSSGWSRVSWRTFEESVPERIARLVATRRMGPAIIVFPDCFTRLGGNQYINSSAVGRYADYLTRELVPFIDSELRTLAQREHRACVGKSSGGYGAVIHGMKYAQHWGAVGSHAGDAGFDMVYRTEWPSALTELGRFRTPVRSEGAYRRPARLGKLPAGSDDGRIRRFLEHMHGRAAPTSAEVMTLMLLAMSATYDPRPSAPNGFCIPVDLETGELIATRWKRWLANDPVHLVRKYRDSLRSLRGIYLDCGWRDQYHIQYGMRRLARELARNNVAHRYLEFDGTHSGVDHRLDVSLPFLYRAIKP